MRISFSPQRRNDTLVLERTAPDRLRINGDLFNFGPLAEGDAIPAGAIPCDWIVGAIERVDGEIHLKVILPHGASPDPHVAFPAPIIDPPEGPIGLPFSAWSETSEQCVEGGTMITTTTHRWQQPDAVDSVFVADLEPEPAEEPDNVEP